MEYRFNSYRILERLQVTLLRVIQIEFVSRIQARAATG